MTDSASTTVAALPDHPVWCREARCELPAPPTVTTHGMASTGGYHESDSLHVEAQDFEVGIAATVVQYDEQWAAHSERRYVGEPQLRIELDNREATSAVGHLTLTEARALMAMLAKQVQVLERVHANASNECATTWALGWLPGA